VVKRNCRGGSLWLCVVFFFCKQKTAYEI